MNNHSRSARLLPLCSVVAVVAVVTASSCHLPRRGPASVPRAHAPLPSHRRVNLAGLPGLPMPSVAKLPAPGGVVPVPGPPVVLPHASVPSPNFHPGSRSYAPWYGAWSMYAPKGAALASPDAQPTYVPAPKLMMTFGDPTHGTDDEIRGTWVVDPQRSAAIFRAYFRHMLRAYGSDAEPDMSGLEASLEESGARLELTASNEYTLRFKGDGGDILLTGHWKFDEGILSLDHYEDVDGIPVKSESIYAFNYFRNDKFEGFVVVNHGLGLAMKRS